MIKTETITRNGQTYDRTYSDAGRQIMRDGATYDEAIDPVDSGRVYTETDTPIAYADIDGGELLDMLEAVL